ncbi:hypothetical protein E3E12_03195 [Formicincola oecophyllae]|uniref:Uncharacterized protein n=1 Tax=Formicincola oecophyllae TaxID=2558361 RepID=A0A4Y6U8P6_9PROT|nr:hypothetical protein [Formicincola oecophyllae]QDH13370.1 hypothetical protein E3E12_03195 [Formicincola oecophyllae]
MAPLESSTFSRLFRRATAGLIISGLLGVAIGMVVPAQADPTEEYAIKQDAFDAHRKARVFTSVNQVLAVLRAQPASASQRCLESIKQMHEARHQAAEIAEDPHSGHTELAQDVADSATEDALAICGADAHAACPGSAGNPALVAACASLPPTPPPPAEDGMEY